MQRTEVFRNPIAPLAVRLTRCIVLSAALALLAGAAAFAQVPNSGALLTITGSTTQGAVNIAIYDSQIHSGAVQAVSTGGCTAPGDPIPTDAYVLQGGAPTGCDPGDNYEVTDGNTLESAHQAFGKTDISGFHVETHYLCGKYGASEENPTHCGHVTSTTQACNTAITICAAADSGFITITNMTGFNFAGTISLTGTSPVCGAASDSAAFTAESFLAPDGSVTLALGAAGDPSSIDSSNCGGYNAPQQTSTPTIPPLAAGTTTTFLFGNDAYKITPVNSNPGDVLTFIPVPVPAGPLGGLVPPSIPSWISGDFGTQPYRENPVFPSAPGSRFSATNFPGQACIPFADFSAGSNLVGTPGGNPVCPEIQLDCTPAPDTVTEQNPHGDCGTFLYSAELDFTIDKNSLPNGVGGVSFLGDHNAECPDTAFNINIFLSYTATAPDPIRGSSNGNSCFAATFDPTAQPVAIGKTTTQETFQGFFPPVIDDPPNHLNFNKVEAGSAVPLSWQTEDSSDKPVTNLTLCANSNGTTSTGGNCKTPWVNVASEAINCTTGVPLGGAITDLLFVGSGLQNLTHGFYLFVWKTSKTATGCVTPVLTFSTGFVSYSVANFKFVP